MHIYLYMYIYPFLCKYIYIYNQGMLTARIPLALFHHPSLLVIAFVKSSRWHKYIYNNISKNNSNNIPLIWKTHEDWWILCLETLAPKGINNKFNSPKTLHFNLQWTLIPTLNDKKIFSLTFWDRFFYLTYPLPDPPKKQKKKQIK